MFPGLYGSALQDAIEPVAVPPPDVRPISRAVAEGWARAVNSRDWRTARRLLDPRLVIRREVGRHRGRGVYRSRARELAIAYPDLRVRTDEVVGRTGEPHVAWVRSTYSGRPRRGPPLDVTSWERWELDDGDAHIRQVTRLGVTRVGA